MDVHRCRFVPYPPSAINALAFSHQSSSTTKGRGPPTLRLAIGRNNGDIEIWNPLKGAWYQESVLRGGKDRSIEGLVWTRDPDDIDKTGFKIPGKLRLFSIGYSTAVTEWNLATGRPIRHSGGNYGEVWCIAAQPIRSPPIGGTFKAQKTVVGDAEPQHQSIAVGCADGAVVLLSTADDDLRLSKILARSSNKKARVLSITYQDVNVIVAGHADSTIRIFDARNGQQLRSMSLGAGPVGGPKETLVWSVRCLSDGTIVSGDSTGTVRFWDAKNYALLQRIKSHVADILDIATSVDGETVVSGGMDRRTTIYRRTGSGKEGDRRRWVEVAHQRLHSHDVKAMATFESRELSILASGGLDTYPIIMPIKEFGKEHARRLSSLPQQPPICSAPGKRLVMSWWDRELTIWWIHRTQRLRDDGDGNEEVHKGRARKLAAKIALQGEESLTCADLSSDGTMIAVSTMSEIKLFRLREKTNGALRVQRLEAPKDMVQTGARIIRFSPDGRWLAVIRANGPIQLYRNSGEHEFRKGPSFLGKAVDLKRLPRESTHTTFLHGSHGHYDRSINNVAFSADSRILATGDLSGYLDTWVLEGYEDLTQDKHEAADALKSPASSEDEDTDEERNPTIIHGQHWIRNPVASLIPKLPTAPLVLSFRPPKDPTVPNIINGNTAVHPTRHNPNPHSHDLPNGEDRLFIFTSEHHMYEFEVLSGKLSDWSRRNPTSSLPEKFRVIRDRVMGSIWDVDEKKERIWLYGSSWLWMFDLSKDLARHVEAQLQGQGDATGNGLDETKKRKRKNESGSRRVLEDLPKFDTGAGSKISNAELGVGLGRKFRRTTGPESDGSRWISLDREQTADLEDDDDNVNHIDGSALVSLRRGSGGDPQMEDSLAEDTLSGQDHAPINSETSLAGRGAISGPSCWGTFKYRPILGIVPLGGGSVGEEKQVDQDGIDDEAVRGVEVALVERPMWDVDLPPRFYGDQEWEN